MNNYPEEITNLIYKVATSVIKNNGFVLSAINEENPRKSLIDNFISLGLEKKMIVNESSHNYAQIDKDFFDTIAFIASLSDSVMIDVIHKMKIDKLIKINV
ncbi:MAG TPA: hypothetical protein DHW82_13225 [Spirochaetia bacterium]|nr:hypothetical protein [Spirochaetia bacterium]